MPVDPQTGQPLPYPPQGGAPAPQNQPPQPQQPAGGPQGGRAPLPAEFTRHVDPNNAIQTLLLQRINKLQPQDGQALAAIPPQAAAVLKRIIPEVGFLIDQFLMGPAGGAAGTPPPGAPMPGAAPVPGAAPAQPRPGPLSRF